MLNGVPLLQRLNELCAGQLDSLSAGEMRKIFPREYEARASDKLHYRYPGVGGESYLDLIMRLQEVRGRSVVPTSLIQALS
eukprot:scaffold296914_cov33-Tisochrysis_lutea.AAC.2